jgi:hypothetical protein
MPDGICVFISSITVKIVYGGYLTEACGIDLCHADCEPGEKNSPLTVCKHSATVHDCSRKSCTVAECLRLSERLVMFRTFAALQLFYALRSLNLRTFVRFPQICMSHHLRERFLLWSRNSHLQDGSLHSRILLRVGDVSNSIAASSNGQIGPSGRSLRSPYSRTNSEFLQTRNSCSFDRARKRFKTSSEDFPGAFPETTDRNRSSRASRSSIALFSAARRLLAPLCLLSRAAWAGVIKPDCNAKSTKRS